MAWFFQYKIKVVARGSIEYKEVTYTGLVPGETFVDAMEKLVAYYGEDDICQILDLKPVFDDLIEFERANTEKDFDYKIIPKEGN